MELKTYFFDTYALMELVLLNKDYLRFDNSGFITTRLNLMELHYGILRKYGEETADRLIESLMAYTSTVPKDVVVEANKFKYGHRKKRLSYVDCIGYIMAKRTGIKFLTGDKEFEGMENVEFVK
ncbi:PIN domain-containing protein [Candidatus Woesearchaeota archaeon]|nr:PIN domain-containing protein [Candidatus Woesearchaeota archaeon]